MSKRKIEPLEQMRDNIGAILTALVVRVAKLGPLFAPSSL